MKSILSMGIACLALAGCGHMPRHPAAVPVEFFTDPEGADVWVEGVRIGMTPMQASYLWSKDQPSRRIEFKLDGYFPETREITRSTAILAVQLQDATDMMAGTEKKSDPVKLRAKVIIPRWPW